MKQFTVFICMLCLVGCASTQTNLTHVAIGDMQQKEVSGQAYEDDWIQIIWGADRKCLSFVLKNNEAAPICIIWDESSFVDGVNRSHRVIHQGVRFLARGEAQPPTVVGAGAALSEIIIPADNVMWIQSGWKVFAFARKSEYPVNVKALLALEKGDERRNYLFSMELSLDK